MTENDDGYKWIQCCLLVFQVLGFIGSVFPLYYAFGLSLTDDMPKELRNEGTKDQESRQHLSEKIRNNEINHNAIHMIP